MCLGEVLGIRDRYVEARSVLEESLTIREAVGDRRGIACSLHALATLALLEGDVEQAMYQYLASLRGFEQLGDKLGLARCFEGVASAAHRQGGDDRAAALFGTAHLLRGELAAPLSPMERERHRHLLAEIQAAREETDDAEEWPHAVAMPLDMALSSCLQEHTRETVIA
jgi:hypothetical protein